MLLPTAVDLLRCVERTLETVIVPTLNGAAERSAAATIRHLLRHVALRIEHEGAIFAVEVEKLRSLLEQAVTVIQSAFPESPERGKALEALSSALVRPALPAHGYRDLATLTAEVTRLRQGVCDALVLLQRHESSLTDAAQDLYESLKRYVAWELDNESKLIDPAFEGFGPRR
jgi:hypothetical protein